MQPMDELVRILRAEKMRLPLQDSPVLTHIRLTVHRMNRTCEVGRMKRRSDSDYRDIWLENANAVLNLIDNHLSMTNNNYMAQISEIHFKQELHTFVGYCLQTYQPNIRKLNSQY